MPENTSQENQLSLPDCFNFVYSALNKANTKGAYSLEEAKTISFVCDRMRQLITENSPQNNTSNNDTINVN